MNLAYAATADTASEAAVSMNAVDIMIHASPVVQLTLLILLGFSVTTWALIFFKWGTIKRCTTNTENFLETFWSGKSMDHIYAEAKKYTGSAVAKVFQAGYVELQRLMERERQRQPPGATAADVLRMAPPESSITNLERAVSRASRSESMRLESSLGFLATTGSTAPFIGLFGTVWGIMSAFQSIGLAGGASIATVAPSISEALIATAVGLAAAIPAVMAYNYYTHQTRALKAQMENFASDFLNIVKRNFLAN
jgi:biopolymer transport protein TolQ